MNWFHYIHRDEKKEICYHTFHSTKGLEYENVAIILGKDFGQDKDLFKLYFKNYGENEEQASDKYEKGRNIFKNIREVVSINFSTQIINRLYDSFMNSNAYTYKAVTKYNIPYAMLYYQKSISLYGQYIVEGIFGDLPSAI